ncbi:MAG: DUF4423 domain-containing protein [Bdellovibrionales bacterium]|nr:DUF4423 domain-containing protein [Bdellovibrionales bacterium]
MELFKINDYRKILHERASMLKRRNGVRYDFRNIAKSCQVQSPYLSKVFKRDAHLSEDQLFLVVEYLGFEDDQSRYIELLFRYQRSSIPQRRKLLKSAINAFKESQLRTEDHLQAEAVGKSERINDQYFLNPHYQLVHLLLETPRFNERPEALVQFLSLSSSRFEQILLELERLQLIERKGGSLRVLKNHFFLSKDSPIAPVYHTLMKNYASPRVQGLSGAQKYGLSALFHGNQQTFDSVRSRLIELIKQVEAEITKETSGDELYQISIDFFPWT